LSVCLKQKCIFRARDISGRALSLNKALVLIPSRKKDKEKKERRERRGRGREARKYILSTLVY
jgi:hypothetical protein